MRMMRIVLLLVLAALVGACATVNRFPNVVVYGSSIRVDGVTDSRTVDGVPEVVVFGASTAIGARPARYRAVWFDAQGRPIQTVVSAWSEMTMDGERPFSVRMVGPGDRAARYRVEIEIL